jgi:hypothetical protein
MAFTNLTPSHVVLERGDGLVVELPPARSWPEAEIFAVPVAVVDGVAVVGLAFGAPQGLPEPAEGTYLLATPRVAEAAARAGRPDVLALDWTAGGGRYDRVRGCTVYARLVSYAERPRGGPPEGRDE